jgi:hypothetical protein
MKIHLVEREVLQEAAQDKRQPSGLGSSASSWRGQGLNLDKQ